MDLSKLSDQELEGLASGKAPRVNSDLSDLSDDELMQLAGEKPLEEPSLMSKIGSGVVEGVVKAGQFVDSYTGAPTRAAVGAIQDGKSPLGAFVGQFGEDPSKAPTSKEMLLKTGVSDDPLGKFTGGEAIDTASKLLGPAGAVIRAGSALLPGLREAEFQPSAADIGGFAGDVALDPTNVVPGMPLLKGTAQGGLKGAHLMAKGARKLTSPLANAAADAAKSTKIGTIAVDTAQSAKRAIDDFFKPKQADDFQKWVGLAERNGIDPNMLPESVEFGAGSSISRIARGVRENPMIGEADMERFRNGLLQVDSAIDNQVAKLGGGPPLNQVEAGRLVKTGYERSVEDLFNNVEMTYSDVIRNLPGIELTGASRSRVESKIAGIEKWAKGRVSRGFTASDREQGKQVLAAIESIKAGNGSLKQTYESMLDIGRIAFKQTRQGLADVPPDVEKFRDLYSTLSEEFVASTRYIGGHDMANMLEASNKKITEFLKNKEPIAQLLDNDRIAPEKLFSSLVSHGDTNKLNALKEMLSPEEFNRLRASYVEGLITRNSDDTINFGALRTKLQRNTSTLGVLFEPGEIEDVIELTKLGEKWGPAVLSTSNTGASNLLRDSIEGIKSGATNRATLELLKDQARGKLSAKPVDRTAIQPAKLFSRPTRGKGEETLKYLQIIGAAGTAKEKEENRAIKKRLDSIRNK